MKMIYLFFLSLFFIDSICSSYLKSYDLRGKSKFTIYSNSDINVKYNLVECFNLFEPFYYLNISEGLILVNQMNVIFKNDGKDNVIILQPSVSYQSIWIRVIGVIDLVPGGITMKPDVTLKPDSWSTSLIANPASVIINNRPLCCVDIKYSVYAISIYPAGNAITWTNEYANIKKNRNQILFNAINSSIQSEYLQKNGDLLYSASFESAPVSFTIANRRIRDFLLIIVANGPLNTTIQYPPVYIRGCLSMIGKDKSCKLVEIEYPMYLILGSAILFFFLAIKYDIIHVLFCGWISTVAIVLVLWHILQKDRYVSDSTYYAVCFGIAPAAAITATFICGFSTKKYNRFRIFFTALVIILILLSVMWFTPLKSYKRNNFTLFVTVSVVLASVLEILLSIFNHLTMMVGCVFITAVLICLSISINILNASIIPFIFIDFYNSILYASPGWIYYSPLLIEDVIIVILCPLLSIIVGLVFYSYFKRSLFKAKKRLRTNNQGNHNCTDIELSHPHLNDANIPSSQCIIQANVQIVNYNDPPPSYVHLPIISNDVPNEPPPSYDTCVRMATEPTAPIHCVYDGPYTE